MIIRLPFPPKELSPNTRADRRYTTKTRADAREAGFALAREAMGQPRKFQGQIHASIVFYPPDGRRRDLDNMLASAKYHIDGIASAIGVDDYHWSFSISRGEPDRPHGSVTVEIEE